MNVLTNSSVPSENPFYSFVLNELEGGKSHAEFQETLPLSINVLTYIESKTKYNVVAKWIVKNGYDKEADKMTKESTRKLEAGLNFMKKKHRVS